MPIAPPEGHGPPPERPSSPPQRPDPALGIYETVLLRDGRPHELDAHLGRLRASVRVLYGLELPPTLKGRLRELSGGACHGPRREQRLRIDAIPRAGRLAITLTHTPFDQRRRDPVRLVPVTVPGGIGAHKWRDRRLLDQLDSDPAPLLVDADQTVLEVAWGNVFVLDGDRLATPPLDGRILPGVTRGRLLALAPSLGLDPGERPIGLAELRRAQTIVVTSSLRLLVSAGFGDPPAPEPPIVTRIREALA
jgi:para-aminobenzoate synthetase / 4-amino-4-deoxychorismate lyase